MRKMKKMVKRKEIIFWIVVVALVVTLAYIGIEKIQERQLRQKQETFELGYIQAIATMYANTNDCQAAVITIGNETRRLIDVACLQPAE